MNVNNTGWANFFRQLRAKKNGKLPPFIKNVNPPGYKKRDSKRELMTFIRMYRCIVNRLRYAAEEYGIEVEIVDEKGTSETCPFHGKKDCVVRIKRGLILCKEINKVFNADLVAAFNILKKGLSVTPSPERDRGNGRETVPRGQFLLPDLPALSRGNPALQGGEKIIIYA